MDGEAVPQKTLFHLSLLFLQPKRLYKNRVRRRAKIIQWIMLRLKIQKSKNKYQFFLCEILEENQEIKVYNTIDSSTNRESCLPVILHNKEKRQQNSQIISPIDLLKVKSNYQYYVKSNTLNINEHYYVKRRTQKRCISKLTNLYDFIV